MAAGAPDRRPSSGVAFATLAAGVGLALDFASRRIPADLPVFLPWDFSWPVYVAVAASLYWFLTGRARLARAGRPGPWRTGAFLLGVALMWGVVQTRYDYLAVHMFVFHRLQHLVLHHLGPFLIALSWPGEALWAGMPRAVRGVLRMRPVRALAAVIQHPVMAPVLFAGLIYFWLTPYVHLRVMLDTNLYYLMNWTMALDGIAFWVLVLDPNPKPPARAGIGTRALLTIAVVPPQIAVGAMLALTTRDYYPVYEICGRILPMTAVEDLNYGGLVLWIPGSMMSVIGLILVLNNMRKIDERKAHETPASG